jgi:hypothetical protein
MIIGGQQLPSQLLEPAWHVPHCNKIVRGHMGSLAAVVLPVGHTRRLAVRKMPWLRCRAKSARTRLQQRKAITTKRGEMTAALERMTKLAAQLAPTHSRRVRRRWRVSSYQQALFNGC